MAPPPEAIAFSNSSPNTLQPPTYAEVLSSSPENIDLSTRAPDHRRWRPHSTTSPLQLSSLTATRPAVFIDSLDSERSQTPVHPVTAPGEGRLSEELAEVERNLDAAFDEQGLELMQRGAEAQRRRQVLQHRARNSEEVYFPTGNLDAAIETELSDSFAYRQSEAEARMDAPDDIEATPSAPLPPGRATWRSPQRNRTIRRQDSIFFHSPVEASSPRNVQGQSSVMPEVVRWGSRESLIPTPDSEVHGDASAFTNLPLGRRMLLLYCHSGSSPKVGPFGKASHELTSPLPDGFYRVDSRSSTTETNSSDTARNNLDTAHIHGGGCGALICARAFADVNYFRSDCPPVPANTDWLEISSDKDTFPRNKRREGCQCTRALLGCRNCGNVVGTTFIAICRLCKQESSIFNWGFFPSAVQSRGRVQGSTPQMHISPNSDFLEQPSLHPSDDKILWYAPDNPTKRDDEQQGLAGNILDWTSRAQEVFDIDWSTLEHAERTLPFFQRYRYPDETREGGDLALPTFRPNTFGTTSPEGADEGAAISSRLGGSAPTRLRTTIERPRSSSSIFSLGDLVHPGAGDILERARTLRRDLREFVSRNYGTAQGADPDGAVGSAAAAIGAREDDPAPGGGRRRRSMSPPQMLESAGLQFLDSIRASRRRRLGLDEPVVAEGERSIEAPEPTSRSSRDLGLVGR